MIPVVAPKALKRTALIERMSGVMMAKVIR
jgi:hypothetical protein